MKDIKRVVKSLPEYYLCVLVFLAGYSPPFSIKPVALIMVSVLVLQIIFRNGISGVIIAVLFILLNIYMLMALFSEFNEFQTLNSPAIQLLLGGLSLFVLNLFVSLAMMRRYTA